MLLTDYLHCVHKAYFDITWLMTENAFLFVTENYVKNLFHSAMRSIEMDTCIRFTDLSSVQEPPTHIVYFAPINYAWYE